MSALSPEFSLIDRYFTRPARSATLGVGDDSALLRPTPGMELAVTSDLLVSGTHFLPDTHPERLGWKTLAVNLSDLAAMGAKPRWVTLALSLPAVDEVWLAAFAQGFFACADAFGVELVGGDTTRGALTLCVTALGEVPRGEALRRDGARAGDDVWISGTVGLAALGLRHLLGHPGLPASLAQRCVAHLECPQPRVELGLALRGIATAALDISDGLLADLGHLARRSGLAARLERDSLPVLSAEVAGDLAEAALNAFLSGGDDYELCFSAPAERRADVAQIAAHLDLPLWRIGAMQTGVPGSVAVTTREGLPLPLPTQAGYDHFCACA
ncbi:MAG: thiamine-phosphate kinase [Zoogloeaceae bacterium]|nr:thiamine-phosphate kinase [Zoogloeaceae bacterium]